MVFSKEFYETFFHLSKQDSVNSYNEAFQKGSLYNADKNNDANFFRKI